MKILPRLSNHTKIWLLVFVMASEAALFVDACQAQQASTVAFLTIIFLATLFQTIRLCNI